MKCALCGLEFEKEEAGEACKGCGFFHSCGLIRCPRCGYEFPAESSLERLIKKWRSKDVEPKGGGNP